MRKNFHYAQSRAEKQADWLARFEDAVVTAEPAHRGRIEWDAAKYLHSTGMTPAEAADRYVYNRRIAV